MKHKIHFKINLLLLFLLFFLNSKIFAQTNSINLSSTQKKTLIIENKNIEFFTDTSNTLNFETVRSDFIASQFKNPDKLDIILPNTNVWFKFKIKNNSDNIDQFILAVPDFSFIDFYIIDSSDNVMDFKAGIKLPASQKQLKNGMFEIVSIHLLANETKTVYVKGISDVAIKMQNLFSVHQIHNYNYHSNLVHFSQGIFNGLLIMMLIYNIFLYYMTRQKVYLYYNLYILNIIISILALLQYLRNYLFSENPEINIYFGFSIFIAFVFYFMFIREFIDSKRTNPKLDNLLKLIIKINIAFAVSVIIISFFNYFFYALFSLVFVVLNMSILLYLVIKIIIKGNKITRIFAFGAGFLIFGSLISVSGRLLGIPVEYILHIFQLSIISELIIFSLGLSYKYKLSEEQIVASQVELIAQYQKNEKLQSILTRGLEKQVKQRTVQISKQNKKIRTLYKEMHHRVKNNLQVISSLIYFQMKTIPEKQNRKQLESIQNRIDAIAAIHELLYSKQNLTEVNLKEFIDNFINYIYSLNVYDKKKINIITNIDVITVEVAIAITIGQIISEAITNSIKYAFAETLAPEININIKKLNNNVVFSIKDNGCGVDEKFLNSNENSLGFKLIKIFARDLKAELKIINKNGLFFEFIFNFK